MMNGKYMYGIEMQRCVSHTHTHTHKAIYCTLAGFLLKEGGGGGSWEQGKGIAPLLKGLHFEMIVIPFLIIFTLLHSKNTLGPACQIS